MEEGQKKYSEISEEKRKKIEEEIYETVKKQFQREQEGDKFYQYEVILQEIKFVTYMTDEELCRAAELAIEILEELKEINNNGMYKQALEQLVKEVEAEVGNDVMQVLEIWNRITTDQMCELVAELDILRRVDGAYAALIANLCLISAIYLIYDRLVDEFEDDELFTACSYFLLRAIMRMNSKEL